MSVTPAPTIGRWCWGVPGCACGMPMPVTPSTAEQQAHKTALVAWLKACPVVERRDQTAPCRFAACAFRPLTAHEHSDGVWRWAETIPHYVEVHDLKIPDALFARAKDAGFVAPVDVGRVFTGIGTTSDAEWHAFAVAHDAQPPPLARPGFGTRGGFLADGTRFIRWQDERIFITPEVEAELAQHALASSLSWTLQDLNRKLAQRLRPVGYWAEKCEHAQVWLPWPCDLVGDDDDDLTDVVDHLRAGKDVEQWMGHSTCRFDGCTSGGSVDLSDGVFVWPQDYWHYVAQHRVRPPADLVAHVRR